MHYSTWIATKNPIHHWGSHGSFIWHAVTDPWYFMMYNLSQLISNPQVNIEFQLISREVHVSLDLMGAGERWNYEEEHTQHVQITLIDSSEVWM